MFIFLLWFVVACWSAAGDKLLTGGDDRTVYLRLFAIIIRAHIQLGSALGEVVGHIR